METKTRKRHKGKIDNDRTAVVIPQDSNKSDSKTKIEVLEEYYNYDSQRLTPITQGTLERLMGNGVKWARTIEDAIKLSQFMDLNGIPKYTWQRWQDKYEIVANGTKHILMILGNKRELGLLTRKFDPGSTTFTMPHYDEDWKHLFEWRAKLTQKDNVLSGQQIVVIERAANSPLVPERKEEE
jgi:hypothetical protein